MGIKMKILSNKLVMAAVGLGLTLSAPAIAHESDESFMGDLGHMVNDHIPELVRTSEIGYCEKIDHALTPGYIIKLANKVEELKPGFEVEYHENYNDKGPHYCVNRKHNPI